MTSIQVDFPSIDKTWTVPSVSSVPRTTKEEVWCIAHSGQSECPRLITIVPFQDYKLANEEFPRCLVHPFIPEEEKIGMTLTDVEFCPDLIVKVGGFGMDRSSSPTKFDRLEEDKLHNTVPGDAFLIRRREEDMKYFTSPEIPVPANWKPNDPNAPLKEQRKEKVDLYRSLNAARSSIITKVVWDYFTVRTTNGWRRKTVAYEKGTLSPFEFQYFDTR